MVILFFRFFLVTICLYYSTKSSLFAIGLTKINPKDQLLWDTAQEFFYQKKYEEVPPLLDKLIKIYPNETIFHGLKAEALILKDLSITWFQKSKELANERRFNHAREALQQAKKYSPSAINFSTLEAKIISGQTKDIVVNKLSSEQLKIFKLAMKAAKEKLDQGDNEQALRLYAEALELVPKATEALEGYAESQKRFLAGQNQEKILDLVDKANQCLKNDQFIQALAIYKSILQIDPVNKEALENIPVLQSKLEEERKVEQRKALVEQYKNTGDNYLKQNEFDEAIEQYELGKQLLPKYTNWKKLIQQVGYAEEEYRKKLEKEYRKVIDKKYNLGLVYLASEKFQDAVVLFQDVIETANKINLESIVDAAEILLNHSKLSLSIQEEEEVNKESPYYNLIQSLKILVLQKIEFGSYQEAQKHIQKILDLFPNNRFANQYLALCQIKTNATTSASAIEDFIDDINKALKVKDIVTTKRLLNIALFIEPNNPELLKIQTEAEKVLNVISRKKVDKSSNNNIAGKTTNKDKEQNKDIEVEDVDVDALWKQVLVAQETNNIPKAIQLTKKILYVNPAHLNARRLLTRLEGGGLVLAARVTIPTQAQKLYTEGILSYNNGDIKAAIQSFKTAISIFPKYTKATIALNKCEKYLATE